VNINTETRLQNLRALRKQPNELSKAIGGRESYWSDMLNGRKSFGEKIARKIEEGLGLPSGALDQVQDRGAPLIVRPVGEFAALMQLYEGIPPERRVAAMSAATNAMIKHLQPWSAPSAEHGPDAAAATPSEAPPADPAPHKTPLRD
jgi:hypothetical protein